MKYVANPLMSGTSEPCRRWNLRPRCFGTTIAFSSPVGANEHDRNPFRSLDVHPAASNHGFDSRDSYGGSAGLISRSHCFHWHDLDQPAKTIEPCECGMATTRSRGVVQGLHHGGVTAIRRCDGEFAGATRAAGGAVRDSESNSTSLRGGSTLHGSRLLPPD